MKKVFIDGSAGTTGLRIAERLSQRKDIELLTLSDELRKDDKARAQMLNKADIVFLCLPDDAARQAVAMVENPDVCIIDTSTAHRTDGSWTYGFPEIADLRDKIRKSKRIANPGCHASGFIALVAPLVACGMLPKNANLSCFSLTGYSGGGKKMIAQYQDPERNFLLESPRQYALSQNHKHLAEMVKFTNLEKAPVFCPVVAPYYSGMQVTVPISREMLSDKVAVNELGLVYRQYYGGRVVRFDCAAGESGFAAAGLFAGRDDMALGVFGSAERAVLVATFDNLGKGASGAAIQNMNLVLGVDETTGLNIGDLT